MSDGHPKTKSPVTGGELVGILVASCLAVVLTAWAVDACTRSIATSQALAWGVQPDTQAIDAQARHTSLWTAPLGALVVLLAWLGLRFARAAATAPKPKTKDRDA